MSNSSNEKDKGNGDGSEESNGDPTGHQTQNRVRRRHIASRPWSSNQFSVSWTNMPGPTSERKAIKNDIIPIIHSGKRKIIEQEEEEEVREEDEEEEEKAVEEEEEEEEEHAEEEEEAEQEEAAEQEEEEEEKEQEEEEGGEGEG